MNDEAVQDDNSLTVVWTVNPFDHLQDRHRLIYLKRRSEIISIVDSWAHEVGSRRTDGLYFDGDVCWILENAKTDLLTEDFANAKRSRFKVINGKKASSEDA